MLPLAMKKGKQESFDCGILGKKGWAGQEGSRGLNPGTWSNFSEP